MGRAGDASQPASMGMAGVESHRKHTETPRPQGGSGSDSVFILTVRMVVLLGN